MMTFLFPSVLLLVLLSSITAWNIALDVSTEVDGAVGGEPFSIQPLITVNNKKGELQSLFEGRVTVQIESSPHGKFEPVWKEGEALPTANKNTFISENVVNGQVFFTGLGINTSGEGYQLKFVLYDEDELLMGTVITDEFTVEVGQKYQLGIVTQPEMAFGGSVFGIQPVLAIQDQGGNIVTDVNEGVVSVSLESSPGGTSTLHCLKENDGFNLSLKDGLVNYKDLFINEAGIHSLRFSTDVVLEGNAYVISEFTVGIGSATDIVLINDASDGIIFGGQAFKPQLRVEVHDAGGNVLVDDSSSAVRISFYSNPSKGVISGETTVILNHGVAQFRNLSIDKAGIGYKLRYDFLQYEEGQLKETSLFKHGSYFNVQVGPPHELTILQHSSGGWAGNQPFPIQPKVALVDAGGNTVIGDSTSIVTASVTPSLAYNSQVIIDTTNDDVPTVTEVRFAKYIEDDTRQMFGPGDVIQIDVVFSQEITLFQMVDDSATPPQLILNTNNHDDSTADAVYAELIPPIQEGMFSRILSFEYNVAIGHSQSELDYSSRSSLYANDYSIEDAFGRSVNLILPETVESGSSSLSASKTIGISDAQPIVESITADLSSGEYGVGEEINFIVTLDREVTVNGKPLLPLNIQDCSLGPCTTRFAEYKRGSDTKTLTFNIIVQPGDDTTRLDIISEAVDAELNFPTLESSITLLTISVGESPIQVDASIEGISLPNEQNISIDTSPPIVTSIIPQASTTPSGTYAVGDTLYFEVSFNKGVEVDVGLELALHIDSGVARYVSGSGTSSLILQYLVKEGDVTSDLTFKDSFSLVAHNTERGNGRLPGLGYVRRVSHFPTTDADLDISHITSMADNYDIVIDGVRPHLLGVSIAESDHGNVFNRGDTIILLVQFSAPVVVVNESSPPLLGLFVGSSARWATYSSGSGTSTLTFLYQVVVGDSSSLPSNFLYRRLCFENKDCTDTEGLLVRLSETLELDADLGTNFSEQGIQIADSPETGVTIDTSMAPITTVLSTTTSKSAGTYSVGEIIDIQVTFTDQVFISGSMPTLLLNTDSFASYYSGKESDTLVFRYVSTESDSVSQLDWVLDSNTNSAIVCTDTCQMVNGNGVDIDLRFYNSDTDSFLVEPLEPIIALDSSPPSIISIGTDKMKSPYCHPLCTYTVGEEIQITVTFDRPVVVQGTDVTPTLDIGDSNNQESKAILDLSKSSDNELVFIYTVSHGHSSNGTSLNYVCTESLCSLQLGGATSIKSASSIPTLDVNLSLPPRHEFGLSGDEQNPIIIDTSGHPEVIEVKSTTLDGTYSPGDTIEIAVLFSRSVIVSGDPYLTLNVGILNETGIATYKGGSSTSTLYFDYIVGLDDTTLDLEYDDNHSLHPGHDGVNSGTIKQASSNSSIDANIELPLPGNTGSLGTNSNIKIDSRKPFISLISASPGEYSTGDKVSIEVQFSRPVVASGTPSLALNVGRLTNRIAEYEFQVDDDTIQFSYTVQLGDSTESLDYWSDGALLPSSRSSLLHLDDEDWIRLKSANPTLDADLHLNPVDGYLDGDNVVRVSEGVAVFRDLKVGQRGKDYTIWYQSSVPSTGGDLQVSETIHVDPSIEYQVQGNLTDRDPGDLYGSSVSLYNNMLAVGAPGKQNPIPEIQVLTVYAEASIEEHEVQLITTSVNSSQAMMSTQQFSTCADVGETVDGSFTLTYNVNGEYQFASPILFDSDVSADQIKTTLEEELNMVGLISVSRYNNILCHSLNSWTWSITFLDSSSSAGILETDGDFLIGTGSYISSSTITSSVDMLHGSFQLVNPFNGLVSRDISYDASSNMVKEAIEEDLAISVLIVQSENMYPENSIAELGRRWTVIFSHHVGEFGKDINVPQLETVSSNLSGKDARVWVHTGFEGRGTLSGHFAMSFRGSNPSNFLPFDASEEEIKLALESLDSINEVSVSNRRAFTNELGKSGYTWTITFESVNKLTEYGWLLDPRGSSSRGNLPTLEVTNHLIGWNANYLVKSETGRGEEDTQAQWMTHQMGSDGAGSGSADIFRNVREQWVKEATVTASDYDSNDAFGTSVSVTDNYLLVGAPSKEVDGLPEQQTMTCSDSLASDGYFVLSFRGFKSSPIQHDATLTDIQNAIIGLYGGTDNIHSTPRLLFTANDWDGLSSGFCDGTTEKSISITFLTPDGGGISTIEKRSGDLELLTVDTSSLVGASITVVEQRVGTVSPTGKDVNNSHPTSKQNGSVYLFQRQLSCDYCEPAWTQIMKFTPMDGLDSPSDAAQFGWSSVFIPASTESSNKLAIIGSPGYSHETGKVYIFHQVETEWLLMDSLTDINWNHEQVRGGRFGSAIVADSDTILISAPYHSNKQGVVYVFRRSEKGTKFLASQAIYEPDNPSDGDEFGHSLALFNNKAVICAPHKSTSAIHISSTSPNHENIGACYVYSREDKTSAFKLDQQLVPSNVLPGDRFGISVAMTNNRIVVGQVEDTSGGKITPPRPVQVVKTYCKQSACINAVDDTKFRLQWVDIPRSTPFLSSFISANQMKDAIEKSLTSGSVSVSRSILPYKDGGHIWRITFDSYDDTFRDVNRMPFIHCDTFATSSLSCTTHVENDVPIRLRSKAHLFDFEESSQTWTEQSFLYSHVPQKQDLLGSSVAIDGDFAVAGAPNREHLNVNSGAALIYDISFLNLSLPDGPYSLTEGDAADINIERSSSNSKQAVSIRTMDPNAEKNFQHYIDELYSLSDITSHDKTAVELVTGNTALGRSQHYGSNETRSRFIQGMYDFQGINDYSLLNSEMQFEAGESVVSTQFKVNDDEILEVPNEHVSIQLNMRGMFPSQLGRLQTNVSISDNGDGQAPVGNMPYQVLTGYNIHEESARMGGSIEIDHSAGMLIVGSDQSSGVDSDGKQLKHVGSAHLFERSLSGTWEFVQTLSPPSEDIEAEMYFGQSVAINKPYGRDDTTILISSPGSSAAFVYTFDSSSNSWTLQSKLTANDAILSSEDRFGGRGAIALHEDVAFVGSSTMEQVYVYRRSHHVGGEDTWDSYAILRSSDYDYDIYGQDFSVQHMHEQGFGIALATDKRTLLVGAPHADYGNRGDVNEREHFNTDGIHNKGLGKGKVYSFYSQPHVQIVTLQSDEKITAGSFRVKFDNHQGIDDDISGYIAHNASPTSFKIALEAMVTVGEVNVESSEVIGSHSYKKIWRISFLSSFEDSLPTLIPQWHDHDCTHCEQFHVSVLSTVEPFVTTATIHSHQPYIEDGQLQPRDVTSTDLFGASIAMDGPQAIIGSMYSAAKTRTTWNFETGDLQGWVSTGTAFLNQPVFGDNSKFRKTIGRYGNVIRVPQSSRPVGRYYIGTFDQHQRSDDSYLEPDQEQSPGSVQGNDHIGTLTSDPFIIRGEEISFLIGGGCDHKLVYVELLVDGHPSLRATGQCEERMDRVHWDVKLFIGRAGQIRIVDNGIDKWGHINADEFQFSWDMYMKGTCLVNNFGQCTEGGGALPNESAGTTEKQHYTGREESPMAGAAYMFLNECDPPLDLDDLSPSNSNCIWVEQERLAASDKRAGNLFGVSVDVDNDQGIAIVGSSNSPAYGFYQEPISVHPHSNSTINRPIPEDLEDLMKSGRTYSATGGNIRLIDYLIHKGHIDVKEASKFTQQAGSVYVFLRVPAKIGPSGEIVQKAFWRTTEDSKFALPDVKARDLFGTSLAIDGTTAVIGSPGRDSYVDNGGGAFVYDMEWIRVKFSKVEFGVLEREGHVKIYIERDLSWNNGQYSIAYSVSDLTAIGVDSNKYEQCMTIPLYDREGCGDYEQTSGVVTFNSGENEAYFTIRVVEDWCIENNMEYAQLNLHQIGGSPLHGEGYRAQLRLMDTLPHHYLSVYCDGTDRKLGRNETTIRKKRSRQHLKVL